MKLPPPLAAYRLASAGLGTAAPLYLYWRAKIGHDDFSRRHERLGRPFLTRPQGPLALVHIEDGGEARMLAPLAGKLAELGFGVLVSVRRPVSGPHRAPRLPQCLSQLSPLDAPQFMVPFLDHWRPDIVLLCGREILPNLVTEASFRRIPVGLINGQRPNRSALLWHKFPGFAATLLRRIDFCLAQTEADAKHLMAIGMQNVQVAGSLKYDLLPAPVEPSALARLIARIGTRPSWVAAKIHPGEEEVVLAAHRRLVREFPRALTVVMPHSPKRAFDVAQIAAKMGLSAAISAGDSETGSLPGAAEAGLFYRATGVVFAGKSLCCGGGKNPAEAAHLGCAILHGPDVEEFEEIYQALDEAGGGAVVSGAETLAKQLGLLFRDEAGLRAMGRAAAATAAAFGGASERIIEVIPDLNSKTGLALVSHWFYGCEAGILAKCSATRAYFVSLI